MSDDITNEALEHPGPVRITTNGTAVDVAYLKTRVTALEIQSAAMNRHLDRLDECIARIERRFDPEQA